MWLTLDKENGFGNVGTAVMYDMSGRGYKYLPNLDLIPEGEEGDRNRDALRTMLLGQSSSFSGVKVLYHGSTKNILGKDFAEYDFSYIIDKPKYNNRFLVSDLDNESKNLIGKSITSIARADSTLFPTLSRKEEEESEVDYFGTVLISNQLLYYFDTPAGISTIELYEGVVETNHLEDPDLRESFYEYDYLRALGKDDLVIQKPVTTIHLGPEPGCRKNPSSMYYSSDNYSDPQIQARLEGEDKYTFLEYSKLYDELCKSKIVWAVLSDGNDNLPSINLAYHSWYNNDAPNRNKHKYCLRNDEFYGSLNSTEVISSYHDTNYLVDRRSNTILGNSEVTYSPILNRKLRSVQNLRTGVRDYCPSISYRSGDEVIFGKSRKHWISLCDENLGNNPYISSSWMLKDRAVNYYTTQVKLISMCVSESGMDVGDPDSTIDISNIIMNKECGKILGGQSFVTIHSNDDLKSFTFVPNPGYHLFCDSPKESLFIYSNNKLKKLNNFTYLEDKDAFKYTFTIDDWGVIVEQPTPTIVIMCDVSSCKSMFKVSLNGDNPKGYAVWTNNIFDIDIFNGNTKVPGSEFILSSYTVNDEIFHIIQDDIQAADDGQNAILYFPANKRVQFNFRKLDRYKIDKVTYVATKASYDQVITGNVETIDSYNSTFTDDIDYNTVTYTLYLSTSEKSIKVQDATLFEVSDINRSIKYGEEYSISFYKTRGNFTGVTLRSRDFDENGNEINIRELETLGKDYLLPGDEGYGDTNVYTLGGMTSGITLVRSGDGVYTIKFKHLIQDVLIYNFK